MKKGRTIVVVIAAAAVAFVIGRFSTSPEANAFAAMQDTERDAQPQESPFTQEEVAAMMEAGTPGEHHQRLNTLAGEWEGVFRIWHEPDTSPMVAEGTISRGWQMGNRFLREEVSATTDWGQYEAVGYTGYNNMTGQYEMIWMDSMSTAIYSEYGFHDPDRNVLRTFGSHRDPVSGKDMPTWGELDMSNPNRHVYTGYTVTPEGREFKTFEGIVERTDDSR